MRSFIAILFIFLSLVSKGQRSQGYLISFVDTSNGNESYGFKTPKGKVVIPAKYDIVATDKFYTFAFVYDHRGWVGINRQDSVLLKPFIFDNFPDDEREGLFRFVEDGKMGFANSRGQKIIPAHFDFVEPFKKGYAAFNNGGHKEQKGEHWLWKGGLWGFIDKKGNVVVEPQFSSFITDDKQPLKAKTKDGTILFINNYAQVEKLLRNKK